MNPKARNRVVEELVLKNLFLLGSHLRGDALVKKPAVIGITTPKRMKLQLPFPSRIHPIARR
jgi:hypothetical protein